MNFLKIVEFIFVIMLLVFLAMFAIFIVLCVEVYAFLCNIDAPFYLRVIIIMVMAFVFLYILRGIISKAEDYKK